MERSGTNSIGAGALWRIPTLGGSSRRIGNILATDASWSPDGAKLAYCNGGNLFLSERDGSDARKIASLRDFLYGPQFSPDGKRIRFTVRELYTGTRSIWEVTTDGTHLHTLLPGWQHPATESDGKWTPDGKYFIFQAQGQIWALPDNAGLFGRTDGKPIRLTTSPLTLASPILGKDGNRLFVVGRANMESSPAMNAMLATSCRFSPANPSKPLPFPTMVNGSRTLATPKAFCGAADSTALSACASPIPRSIR